jgi:hypothetical protein
VFWTVPVDEDAVDVDFDDARARLRVRGLELYNDHDLANSLTYGLGLPGDMGFAYPHINPVQPVRARVSFDIEWSGLLEAADLRNAKQGWEGSFLKTGATIRWSSEEAGFTFESEAPNPARNLFAVFGRERNGVFFT